MDKLNNLRQNQQNLESKISMLKETNKKKDEEAVKIRELIAECRKNLDRIKDEANNPSRRPESQNGRRRNKSDDRRRSQSMGGRLDQDEQQSCSGDPDIYGEISSNKPDDGRKLLLPCGGENRSDRDSFREACMDNSETKYRAEALREHIKRMADLQEKSRQCIEKLGEKMEKQVRMKIIQGQQNSDADGCDCTKALQEKVSCKIDLNKMKLIVRGAPEDLKQLDAVQLINLLDKCQCQELIINPGENDCQVDPKGDVPLFYATHPGNLVLLVGLLMIAFLLNANLANTKRSAKTRLFLNMLYFGTFAFHYGLALWMTFFRSVTLNFELPRELFNSIDNLLLPKHYSICVLLSAITFYALLVNHCPAPCTTWPLDVKIQIIIKSTVFLIELMTVCYIVPAILKLREMTEEFPNEEDDCSSPERYKRNMEKLTKLGRLITVINLTIIVLMGSTIYYLITKLNIG